jgi:hypothetical protein
MDKPTVVGNDTTHTIGSDGKQLGTSNSASVAVNLNYFIAVNIAANIKFPVLKIN